MPAAGASNPRTRGRDRRPIAAPEPGYPYSVLEQVERHQGTLKVADLVRIYGVNRKTIYARMDAGRIPVMQEFLPAKLVDPKTLAFVIRRKNPMTREAEKHS